MRDVVVAFVCGAVFAVGLALAGMTQPAKVVAFLDFFGNWDPSLGLVMAAAIAVYMPFFRRIVGLRSPFMAQLFDLPSTRKIDARLVTGAAVFGVGWGLGGFCPGPALVSLATGSAQVAVFVAAMVLGMLTWRQLERRGEARRAAPEAHAD